MAENYWDESNFRTNESWCLLSQIKKILAIASGGGHWIQLCRLRSAFKGCDVTYVTTLQGYRKQVEPDAFYVVKDANRWDKKGLLIQSIQILKLVIKIKPHIVITTGAAPGYFAIRFAKLLGAKCVWIDSVANVEELSLSGQKAGKHVDLWLTQWPHLATENGPKYAGSVL